MAVGNNGAVKAPNTYITWGESAVTVPIGGTATITFSPAYSVTAAVLDGALGGIASSSVNNGVVTLSGLSAGTTTLPVDTLVGTSVYTTNSLTVTVVASAEDESYLNKRGLTHFWNNIDDIKQNKLTAGDNISITSNTISANTGWVYLGEQSLSADSDTLTYTLPAQYDNYKVVFYGAMASSASDGCWIDFIMYNGSTAINVVHQVQLVAGTTWSSAFNGGTFAMNIQSNPYAGLLFKFESWRAGANDWRHYTGSMASNAGGSGTTRTSIVNGRATSATQPTAFAVKTYGTGNVFNTGATIRVWASNNEH